MNTTEKLPALDPLLRHRLERMASIAHQLTTYELEPDEVIELGKELQALTGMCERCQGKGYELCEDSGHANCGYCEGGQVRPPYA